MTFQAMAEEAVLKRGAMQKPSELATLLELLAPLGLGGVLEIGGMHGGTMWCWAQVCDGPYVCVDLQVLGGRMERLEGLDCQLIVADSTDPETPKQLDDQKFDFIFIDGSHRYEDVTRDAENWLPLLAEDGVIAFHDICHRRMKDHDMWRFWNETISGDLDCHYPEIDRHYHEIYDPEQPWGGIGVLSRRVLGLTSTRIEKTPPQCQDPTCEHCGEVLDVDHDEEILCPRCAASPLVAS